MPPPPERVLDERAYSAALRETSARELLSTLAKPSRPPEVDPPMATVDLRADVLEAKELLRRAGRRPDDDARTVAPKKARKASAKFNAQWRPS